MNSLTAAISLAATLATAHAALAQHTRVICEVSANYGSSWHDTLTVWPGQRVDVRVRFELVDVPAGLTVLGFSGATFQPALSGWRVDAGDTRLPFTISWGTPPIPNNCPAQTESSYQGHHVCDGLGVTGRIFPFGSGGQGSSNSSGVLTAFVDINSTLRFAGSRNTTPNTNSAWGVASAQLPQSLAGTRFDSSLNPTPFKYAVSLGPRTTSPRQLIASVPRSWMSAGIAKWYLNALGSSILNITIRDEDIIPATIQVRERCAGDLAGRPMPNPMGPNLPDVQGPDGSMDVSDLVFFLEQFEKGLLSVDIDNGSGEGVPDQAVTIDDLLRYLIYFESAC